jgi:hypothetical protein
MMGELAELLAGIDRIRLRQSRAIARIVDARSAALKAHPEVEDDGYDFAVSIVAAAVDRPVEEIEELAGSILELGPAVTRIMGLAGFAIAPGGAEAGLGEAPPAAGPRTGSGGSMPPSPPAMATRPRRSAK